MARSRLAKSPVAASGPGRHNETSSLAKLYAPSVSRLLALSPAFDELLNAGGVNRPGAKASLLGCLRVLKIEKQRLSLIDRAIKMFLQCQGGQRELIWQAKARKALQVASAQNYAKLQRMVTQRSIYTLLHRAVIFGLQPFDVSKDEIVTLTRYFETRSDDAELAVSDQSRAAGSPAATSRPDVAGLSRLLSEAEPDVIAIRSELEAVSRESLSRTTRLSEELENQIHAETGNLISNKVRLVRAALELESRRADLLHQCVAGIVRSFGGQQRLSLEAEWRRNDEAESIADPHVKAIVDRLTDETFERKKHGPDH
jgi:hypothetical protein